MKDHIFINLALLFCFAGTLKSTATQAQTADSLLNPQVALFAPGEIPTTALRSAAPAFSADGKTVLLGLSPGNDGISVMQSHLESGKWTVPELPVFSGKYHDLEPVFSPDGKYLIFASNRPATAGGAVIDGNYDGRKITGGGGNLWKIKYSKKEWGIPEILPALINANNSVFSPAIAGDGSLYFMRADSGTKFHIYRAQMRHGKFEKPVPASFTNYKYGDFDPAVAPDESFLVFSSPRPPALPHTADLFIVFRGPKGWGDPIDLRLVLSEIVYGVEARLSPDHKTLYFSNSRDASGARNQNASYIWKVDISGILKAHGLD